MRKKQLAALFICGFIPWTIGNALFTLLPIYAARLGADSAVIGNYLASAFFALAVGTAGAGWLSNRFQRRKAFIVGAGMVSVPATWLMGQTTQFWQLVVLTAIVWFCAGVIISMSSRSASSACFCAVTSIETPRSRVPLVSPLFIQWPQRADPAQRPIWQQHAILNVVFTLGSQSRV